MAVRTVLQQADIARALTRISHEILESNHGADGSCSSASPPAASSSPSASPRSSPASPAADVPAGALDVTMYRDDLRRHPTRAPQPTQMPAGGIDGKTVVLVDDVLFSGRTHPRRARRARSDLGRARAVRLAVLVDRGHRELPIRADFVGKNLPSSRDERINVRLAEVDGDDAVTIDGGED